MNYPQPLDLNYYKFERKCDLEEGKTYMLIITECDRGEIVELEEGLKYISGYDETTNQTLQHDTNGNVYRG